MGCYYYPITDFAGNAVSIHFSEGDEEARCLCTSPERFEDVEDPGTLRSLAYLGAAVLLASREEISVEGRSGYGYIYLPGDLPESWKAAIDAAIPEKL